MNTEQIIELIDNSDLQQMQKNVFNGFISRSNAIDEKRREDKEFVSKVANTDKVSEVVFSNDDVKIYTVVADKDEWNVKYPYRSIFKDVNGKWNRVNTVSPTFDLAFLLYLEHKHLGYNSQFSYFAMKMLGIPEVE